MLCIVGLLLCVGFVFGVSRRFVACLRAFSQTLVTFKPSSCARSTRSSSSLMLVIFFLPTSVSL